jgi:signal transduction histidine kinase
MSATDRRDLSELVRAAAAVAEQTDLDAVLRTTVTVAKEATGAGHAALGVIGAHGELSDFVYLGVDRETAEMIGSLPAGHGVLGSVIREPRTVRLNSIADHPSSAGFPSHHPPMSNFLGTPIRVGERIFGNLYLTDKPEPFNEDDESLVEALAAVAGSAINAARLHDRMTQVALVEDRERIARDIHDAVIQDLFAVGLDLQGLALTIEDLEITDRLDRSVQRIDDAISSLRTFIFDLRSMSALHSDPVKAIRRMAERLAGSRDVRVSVTAGDLGSPSATQLDNAMQIVREAVSNAIRHGMAKSVEIRLDRDGPGLVVTITDDGGGFDPTQARRGMGLDNMRERASRLGGGFSIDSTPGAGTRLRVRLER